MSEHGMGLSTKAMLSAPIAPPRGPLVLERGQQVSHAPLAESMPPPAHRPKPQLLHLPLMQPRNSGLTAAQTVTGSGQTPRDSGASTANAARVSQEGSTGGVTVGGEDAGAVTVQGKGGESGGQQKMESAGDSRVGVGVGAEGDLVPTPSPRHEVIPLLRYIHHSKCLALTTSTLPRHPLLPGSSRKCKQ